MLKKGDSGKSTILKQMRIIHGKKYTIEERKKYTHLIVQNMLDSLVRLYEAMKSLFYFDFENELNEAYYDQFVLKLHEALKSEEKLVNTDWYTHLNTYYQIINSIWNDEAIRFCFKKRNFLTLN